MARRAPHSRSDIATRSARDLSRRSEPVGTSIPLRSGHWHDHSGSCRSVPIPKRRQSSARPIIFACGEQELRTRNDGSIVILIVVVVFVLLVVILVLVLVQVMLELAPQQRCRGLS